MTTLFFTLLVAFVALISLQIVLLRLVQHRVDLKSNQAVTDGSSRIWQVNVMRPSNYTIAGRRLLRWYYLLLVLWAVSLCSLLVQFVRF